jgi:hypothetical protein
MQNLLSRRLRAPLDHAADATTRARFRLADPFCEPFPETEADRLRAARLRRRLEEGRASGLLSEEDDEVTLA